MRNLRIILISTCMLFTSIAYAHETPEKLTQSYYQTILEKNPQALEKFLYSFPKGGDLHYHPSGSSFSENLIRYAEQDNLCIDMPSYKAYYTSNCKPENQLNNIKKNEKSLDALIDAWSMQHFESKQESGHDHFFGAFTKFSVITQKHLPEIIAESVERAASQNVQYLEFTLAPDHNESGNLGRQLGWHSDFDRMRRNLLASDIAKIVNKISLELNELEDKKNKVLACTQAAKPGCAVTIRYLYQVYREQAPEKVFAQLLAGFLAAENDKRIVGINMVQAEDGKISMRDYALHMSMVAYFHKLFPKVHISLHAGELNERLVPVAGLKFHIRSAVQVAGADRIGHGVSISHEDNVEQLLQMMAAKKTLVEINLSSNKYILDIAGKMHPLPIYLSHNVPVALSTDDEGISREDMTHQFMQAAQDYKLSYENLKKLSRNSIAYSFLSGANLWEDVSGYHRLKTACAQDDPSSEKLSLGCANFLRDNEKASMQWQLEKRFKAFELRYTSAKHQNSSKN